MALTDTVQKIIDGHEFEVSAHRGSLGFIKGKMIHLKEDVTNELFSNFFTKICELLGAPMYVHSSYGYIWKVNGEVLSYRLYEKNYHYEVIAFYILNRLPVGKKLKYHEYVQIDEMVKQVFAEHNLISTDFVHYADRKFMFLGGNTDEQILLILKPHFLEFYCSKKEPYKDGMTKVVPCYSRKEPVSFMDISKLKRTLCNCFKAE